MIRSSPGWVFRDVELAAQPTGDIFFGDPWTNCSRRGEVLASERLALRFWLVTWMLCGPLLFSDCQGGENDKPYRASYRLSNSLDAPVGLAINILLPRIFVTVPLLRLQLEFCPLRSQFLELILVQDRDIIASVTSLHNLCSIQQQYLPPPAPARQHADRT